MISSEDRSSEVVEYVKVCDICGDLGEEEKLAVCSRCNDGAEHTYCMQLMIEDVPDGTWFCEECQAEVDIENKKKKREISQVKAGTISSENKTETENGGNEKSDEACQFNGMSSKAKQEDAGILDKPEPETCNVRVCDICGDVGEEKKLAVCTSILYLVIGTEHILVGCKPLFHTLTNDSQQLMKGQAYTTIMLYFVARNRKRTA